MNTNSLEGDETLKVHDLRICSLFFLTWPLDFTPVQCYYHQLRDNSGAKLRTTDCRHWLKIAEALDSFGAGCRSYVRLLQ